ncbi:MAG: hypothetical protein IT236_06410 [Bacteroidia bacterium]|nr:hypothetical protein [Bacteroidia bacterium]
MNLIKKIGAVLLIVFCGIFLIFFSVSILKGITTFIGSEQDAFNVGYLLGTLLFSGLFGFGTYKLMMYALKLLNGKSLTDINEETHGDKELE